MCDNLLLTLAFWFQISMCWLGVCFLQEKLYQVDKIILWDNYNYSPFFHNIIIFHNKCFGSINIKVLTSSINN